MISCSTCIFRDRSPEKPPCDNRNYDITYEGIYKDFLLTYHWADHNILDYRPAGSMKIKIWTKGGPIYIYDYANKDLKLDLIETEESSHESEENV